MLFESVVREDRSLVDLLNADYTFVDERLARHYGIPNIHGSYFRRVTLPADSPRRGLLGQGSILTVTSVATRTSPVHARPVDSGKRARHAGADSAAGRRHQSREGSRGSEEHVAAAAPGSASRRIRCARRATRSWTRSASRSRTSISSATWRDLDGRTPVDPSGQLVDGTKLNGPGDLRGGAALPLGCVRDDRDRETLHLRAGPSGALRRHADGARDRPSLGSQNDYRFSSLVLGVVESAPFQMKMKKP